MKDKTCESCRWFALPPFAKQGTCRRFPPDLSGWPAVDLTDFCGEYSSKKTATVHNAAKEDASLWDKAFHSHFWPEYPRKVGKKAALKAWRGIRPRKRDRFKDAATAILRLLKVRKAGEWIKRTPTGQDGPDFPYPATFLNQESFETRDVEDARATVLRFKN